MAGEGSVFIVAENGTTLPRMFEDKKKIAEILLDPRTIAMADTCPEKKEEIASMVRKLQAEREMRRRSRNGSDWTSKFLSTFNCTNLVRMFLSERESAPVHKKTCRRHRNHGAGDAPVPFPLSDISDCETLRELSRTFSEQNNFLCDEPPCSSVPPNVVHDARVSKHLEDNCGPTFAPNYVDCFDETSVCQKGDQELPEMPFTSLNSCAQNGTTYTNLKVLLNGMDLTAKTYIMNRFQDMAGILLQNANLPPSEVIFNFLPNEAQNYLRVIHDLNGNDCSNLKSIKANLIPTKSCSSVIILEPVKITEVPVCSLSANLQPYKNCVSSSTQTDSTMSVCFCSECEMSDSSSYYVKMEEKNFEQPELTETSRLMVQKSQLNISSTHFYSLNKGNPIHKIQADSPHFDTKNSTNHGRNNSSEDSESDFCFSMEESGARFLSKILKASKPPNRNLISPEVIITTSCRNSCSEKPSESDSASSFHKHGVYAGSSGEAVAVDEGTIQAKKWPRKRMKTCSDSYYAVESSFRLNQPGRKTLCQSGEQDACNEKPPEISTGYSQLSETSSVENGIVYYIKEDGLLDDQPILNIEVDNGSDDQEEELKNNEEPGNYAENDYTETLDTEGSLVQNYELSSDISESDRNSIMNRRFGIDQERSPLFPKAFEQGLGRNSRYAPMRRSVSAICVTDNARHQMKQVPMRRIGSADKVVSSDHDDGGGDGRELIGSGTCTEVGDVKNTYNHDLDETSSEEEKRRNYERNFRMIRIRARNDKESKASSNSIAASSTLSPRKKTKKQNQPPLDNKSKDKSKHKHCSIM